jgi:hypothetical protein
MNIVMNLGFRKGGGFFDQLPSASHVARRRKTNA